MRRWRKGLASAFVIRWPIWPFRGRDANEIERARISMMARNATVPLTGRIQKRKTNHLRIITFGLQRAAGPYRWATFRLMQRSKCVLLDHLVRTEE
jgi:hypothetical protein